MAILKIHKAMFGSRVLLNGVPIGEREASFTPGLFDARAAIREGANEILVRVVLDWETACAKAYSIEVSLDGTAWKEVFRREDGKGGSEEVRLGPVKARWVRLRGTQRATQFGYSLWEFRIYR